MVALKLKSASRYVFKTSEQVVGALLLQLINSELGDAEKLFSCLKIASRRKKNSYVIPTNLQYSTGDFLLEHQPCTLLLVPPKHPLRGGRHIILPNLSFLSPQAQPSVVSNNQPLKWCLHLQRITMFWPPSSTVKTQTSGT